MEISTTFVGLFWYAFTYWITYIIEAREPSLVLPHRGCYLASWARNRSGRGRYVPENIDPKLCTFIIFAFGQIRDNEVAKPQLQDEDDFRSLMKLKHPNPLLKILLSVGGWTFRDQFPSMAASAANRSLFVNSCVKKLRQWKFDGIDIDWEYPTTEQKGNFAALLNELRSAFEKESVHSGQERLLLGAAVWAIRTDGYDVPTIRGALDFVNVMTYDFHTAGWEPNKTGHHSPLYPSSSDPARLSISTSLQKWLALGMPKSKLNVGLAFYGRSWTLADPNNHSIGAEANGSAPVGPFTREAGVLGYNEICTDLRTGKLNSTFDEETQSPYAYGGSTWVSYDDEESISLKADYIVDNDFAGSFVWELANDDFNGDCYGKPNVLLAAIRDRLENSTNIKEYPEIQVCDKAYCEKNGPGSFALGSCEIDYCDCGDAFSAYRRICPGSGSLRFHPKKQVCSWKSAVPGCFPAA